MTEGGDQNIGESLQEAFSPENLSAIEDVAQQSLDLQADVEGMFDEWKLEEFDQFFQKCEEDPLNYLILPEFFLRKFEEIMGSLPAGNTVELTPPEPAETPQDLPALKAVAPRSEKFVASSDEQLVPEMQEKRPDLYNMINYASSATGVPFSILAATFRHESNFNFGAVGDGGGAVGIGQMHPAAYTTATSSKYYQEAMQFGDGESVPECGTNPLSDILATACLYRVYADKKKYNVNLQNPTQRDIVFLRALYHHPKYAVKRTAMYAQMLDGSFKEDEGDAEHLAKIRKYAKFADRVVIYEESLKNS